MVGWFVVDKVRTRVVESLEGSARIGSRVVVDAWVWGVCIYLHGKDRRGNLGALPDVPSVGFHASRFALAFQEPNCLHDTVRYVEITTLRIKYSNSRRMSILLVEDTTFC